MSVLKNETMKTCDNSETNYFANTPYVAHNFVIPAPDLQIKSKNYRFRPVQ